MNFPTQKRHGRRVKVLGRAQFIAPSSVPLATITSSEGIAAKSFTIFWSANLISGQQFTPWHLLVTTNGVDNPVTLIGCAGDESTVTCSNDVDPTTTFSVGNPTAVRFATGTRTTDNGVHTLPP